jgi:hypothetical protein
MILLMHQPDKDTLDGRIDDLSREQVVYQTPLLPLPLHAHNFDHLMHCYENKCSPPLANAFDSDTRNNYFYQSLVEALTDSKLAALVDDRPEYLLLRLI